MHKGRRRLQRLRFKDPGEHAVRQLLWSSPAASVSTLIFISGREVTLAVLNTGVEDLFPSLIVKDFLDLAVLRAVL